VLQIRGVRRRRSMRHLRCISLAPASAQ
jgi:hypothetical protein